MAGSSRELSNPPLAPPEALSQQGLSSDGNRTYVGKAMSIRPYPHPAPSLAAFERIANEAFASLPLAVRSVCTGLAIRVADFAPDDILDSMGIEDPFELTGLYEGIALTERSVMDQPTRPDAVWLFRRPILEEWIERGDVKLDQLVQHVLVHEIAHHLGWSDTDIREVDDWTK
jgi:predicted Zn-dependent protease with MMP-like domain